MDLLHPEHGARFVLTRLTSEPPRYQVAVYRPGEAVHEAEAVMDDGVSLGQWTSAPPAWAATFVDRLLRSLAKKHGADASWPRKITRWREEER